LCVVYSACSDDLCNNKRYASCKLYEQSRATETSTFGKWKIGPPRQLLRTVHTVTVDSAHSYCRQYAVTADNAQLLRTVRRVTVDRARLLRTMRSYFGQCAQLLRAVRTVTADSAYSYCGQCAVTADNVQLLQTVRTVTADRSNEQMLRK